jgi:hypothetical protein
VAAAEIFKDHRAVYAGDLRLLPADAAIAQRQFIAGLAADAKRKGRDRHLAPYAVRFNHDKSGCSWHVL